MKKYILIVTFVLIGASAGFAIDKSCQKHIALLPAKEVAKEFGKSEMWVLRNYKVALWKKNNANGKYPKVGVLLPSSHARIIETYGNGNKKEYKVMSPYDKSVGWVSSAQVKKELWQDIKTRKSCSPK